MQTCNQWLEQSKDLICREVFYGPDFAKDCHISYAWPSNKGLARKNKTIGQAWDTDGKKAIFISPWLFKQGNDLQTLGVLIHELIHIKIGTDKGHRGGFKKEMKEVGLAGKPTATVVSEELKERLNSLKEFHDLPDMPVLDLDSTKQKKQGTRMLLLMCECSRKLRVSGKVYEEGKIACKLCNSDFELQD